MPTPNWATGMVKVVRVLIGDIGDTPVYSDDRLTEVLIYAALLTVNDVDFDNIYTINLLDETITPDPIDVGDTAFQTLVSLKAASILAISDYKTSSAFGVSIKDGPSSIDAENLLIAKKELSAKYAADYDKARIAYKAGNGVSGAVITTPYAYES